MDLALACLAPADCPGEGSRSELDPLLLSGHPGLPLQLHCPSVDAGRYDSGVGSGALQL